MAAAFSCANANDAGGGYGDGDASADAREHAESGGGPSPDAIVLGDDGPAGVDAPAVVEAGDEPPITNKSCTTLPDGTPCAPAPDICHDAAVCMGGACAAPAAKADGVTCGKAPDICHADPVCKGGVCAPPANADGVPCGTAPDACHDAPACSGGTCGAPGPAPDGTNWSSGDATAICCSGNQVHANTDTDCGACGIHCNAANMETCQALGGRYFCRGCVASSACWSHCCSTTFGMPYTCAASDCAGNCSATYCPAGTHCALGGTTSSDYCSY
jgi:hypothetical protein